MSTAGTIGLEAGLSYLGLGNRRRCRRGVR